MSAPAGRLPRWRLVLGVAQLVLVPVVAFWAVSIAVAASPVSLSRPALGPLLLALAVMQLAFWTVSLRLSLLVGLFGVRLPSLVALGINLQATFYFFVIPTQAGLEALRFLRLRGLDPSPKHAEAVTALLLDRILGAIGAVFVFAAAALVVLPRRIAALTTSIDTVSIVVVIVAVLMLAAALLAFRYVDALARLVRQVVRGWRAILAALVLSVVSQALVAYAVQLACASVGVELPFVELCLAIAGGTFLMVIPVSIGGLGPADVGMAALLVLVGVPEASALVATFTTYLTRVLGGLQGGAIEAWNGGTILRRYLAERAVAEPAADPRQNSSQ